MEQVPYAQIMTEINKSLISLMKLKNPTVEYLESHNLDHQARRLLFYKSGHLPISRAKYLVNYCVQYKMSLYENPYVVSHVLEHGTLELIKYTINVIISNNLLDIEYFDEHGFIFQIIKRGNKDLIEYFTNFCIGHEISLDKLKSNSILHETVFDVICTHCELDTIECFVNICLRNGINIGKINNLSNNLLKPLCKIMARNKSHPENYFQTFKYLIDLYAG